MEDRVQALNAECGPCEIHKMQNFHIVCSNCPIHLEREKEIEVVMKSQLGVI